MAFETGTAASLAALVTALDTFMVANGWVQDLLNTGAGKAAWHRTATGVVLYVGVRWDTTSVGHMGVYQALAFTDPPGTDTTDSGNGANSSTNSVLDDERHVNSINNGPFTYWFFEQDHYVHVVVESAPDVFKHFGWGALEKTGDWTGGEYAYGHYKVGSGARSVADTLLLDGAFDDAASSNEARAATLHLEGLPNQAASGKWGQTQGSNLTPQNDTAGIAKAVLQGGFRGGPTACYFGTYAAGSGSGGIPMYPIEIYYQDLANFRVYFLGRMKDVRGINIRFFAPRDVVSISGSDWYIFPSHQKGTGAGTHSANQGIAYRRDNG